MLRKVYEAQKQESKKGDFVALTKKDKEEMDIILSDNDIQQLSKRKFKKLVKEKTKIGALRYLNKKKFKKKQDKKNNL